MFENWMFSPLSRNFFSFDGKGRGNGRKAAKQTGHTSKEGKEGDVERLRERNAKLENFAVAPSFAGRFVRRGLLFFPPSFPHKLGQLEKPKRPRRLQVLLIAALMKPIHVFGEPPSPETETVPRIAPGAIKGPRISSPSQASSLTASCWSLTG